MKFRSKIGKSIVVALIAVVLCAAMAISVCVSSVGVGNAASASGVTKGKYYTDFATFAELEDAAAEVGIKVAEEGAVLLKNRNDALPLTAAEMNVCVFGDHSDNILQAGGGAGGGSSARSKTLKDSMESAGFSINPSLVSYYDMNGNPSTESDPAGLDSVAPSFAAYNGAAIVVISRSGSEMRDITINDTTNGLPGYADKNAHSMMLQDNEQALIDYVKESGQFDKVVVVLNTPAPMEIAGLEDDDEVDSILWIGLTGAEGIMALGRILNGEVNPSGRTVDVYAAKFDTEPTWFNVSNAKHLGSSTVVRDSSGEYEIPGNTGGFGGAGPNYASLDYEEGIYMGYRFYETAVKQKSGDVTALEALATTTVSGSGTSARNAYNKAPVTAEALKGDAYKPVNDDATYDVDDIYYNRYNGVLYPYGYGLSYTEFAWEIVDKPAAAVALTDADKNKEITVSVKVTNTGDFAGKDVVQLYSDPQYYNGGIEKASANLITFAKTKLLLPGESDVVELKFTPFELASFDDVDKNGNGFAGYELEAGTYVLSLNTDSHVVKSADCTLTYTVAADQTTGAWTKAATAGANGIAWTADPVTGTEIEAVFSDASETITATTTQFSNSRRPAAVMADPDAALEFTSRSNFVGTFPDAPTAADVTFNTAALNFLDSQQYYFSYQDKTSDPWYKTAVPAGWDQADTRGEDDVADIQLWDMVGVPLTDAKWTTFMNQLTWSEMVGLISSTGFNTPAVDVIGKPKATDSDGPAQLSQRSDSTYWPGACVIGSTYNVELAELLGVMVGNEGLFKDIQGWYAPSMNIHRSPFSGRNFEYYGQDGVHSGLMAAAVVKGARSKGMVTYIKHFALNDQEQDRQLNGGVITWASEQSMREIYLRSFEYAVKRGDANATMGSFNRIGIMPSVTHYDFYVSVTREEWGFYGYSVTDMYAGGSSYWPGNIMARCGTGPLGSYSGERVIEGTWDAANNTVLVPEGDEEDADLVASPTQYFAVRDTAQRLLYVAANSALLGNGYKVPLKAFADGTQPAIAGGWGSTGQEEIRKDLTGFVVGTKVENVSIGLTEAQLGALELSAGSAVTYTVTSGALPAGLSLNASTGAITGTPSEAGEFNVTFTATVDNYVKSDKLLRLIVTGGEEAADPVGDLTEAVGELQGTIEDLNSQIGALEDRIEALEGEVDALQTPPAEEGGCGSSVAFGVTAAILASFGLAAMAFLIAKKRSDKE